MRKSFQPQLTLRCTPIEQVEAPVKTKSHLAALAAALQYIYVQPEWNQRIFELLSSKLIEGKKKTGREGMSLWEVFVLAQVRLCMNISYDEYTISPITTRWYGALWGCYLPTTLWANSISTRTFMTM